MNFYSLAGSVPHGPPATIQFEGQDWRLWPLDVVAIASQLETWVAQFVRQNVEKLRPDKDDDNPVAWRIYQEDKEETRKSIERGDYAALMPAWYMILCRHSAPGFREAIYQCMAFKNQGWTRDHTRRLLADDARYDAVFKLFDEINFPKAQASVSLPQQPASE